MKTHSAAEAAQLAHTEPQTLERIELIERAIGMCTAQMEQANKRRHELLAEPAKVKHASRNHPEGMAHYHAQWTVALCEVVADYRCWRKLRALAQTEHRALFPQQPPEQLEDAAWLNAFIETMEPDAILCRRPTNGI